MVASGEKLLKDMNQVSALGSTPEPSTLLTHQTAANEERKKKGAFQITDVRQGQEATDISFDTTILEEDDDDDDLVNELEAAGGEGVSVIAQSSEPVLTHGAQNELNDPDAKSQRFRVVKLQGNLVNDERGRWRCHDAGVDVLERNASNGSSSAESSCVTGEQSPVGVRRHDAPTSSPSLGALVTSTPTTGGLTVARGHGSEVCARYRDDALTCSVVKDDVSEVCTLSRQTSVEMGCDSGATSPEMQRNADSSSHRSLQEAAVSTEWVTAAEHVPESSRDHPICNEHGHPKWIGFMGEFETLLSKYVTRQTGELEGKNRELEKQITELQGKLKSLQDDNKELQETNSSLQQQQASLQQEYSNLQEENTTLHQELGSMRGRDPVQ